jgi:O-antigen/teichoic acid export membrane protein
MLFSYHSCSGAAQPGTEFALKGSRLPRFRRDLALSIASSGAGFAITLVTTPLMTRIFSAEAYGVNGMMLTAASLISAFGLFGLPVALAQVQTGTEQMRLFHISAQLAVVLGVFCSLGVGAALLFVGELPSGLTAAVACLFPLLALVHAAQRIVDSLAVARGLFTPLAVGRIANATATRGLTLGLGWLVHAGAGMMILGDIVGKVVHMAVVARGGGLVSFGLRFRWWPEVASLRTALRDYRDFALYSNIAAILPMVTGLGLQVLIGLKLGTAATGHYVLAQSILSLPVSLIAMASAPVVFHRMVRSANETPTYLIGFVLKAMLGYVCVGAVLMLPITIFGPKLFAFVFGEPWRPAGVAAAVLSLPQILAFSLTALLSTFRVTRRIKEWLGVELLGTTLVLGGFALMPSTSDLAETAGQLVILMLCYQVLMHVGCLWAARLPKGGKL